MPDHYYLTMSEIQDRGETSDESPNRTAASSGKSTNSMTMSTGAVDRLKDGGFNRIIHGWDLYLALLTTIALGAIQLFAHVDFINLGFVGQGTNLAISLTAFILAGLAILVSFSDEKFLGLLKELEI